MAVYRKIIRAGVKALELRAKRKAMVRKPNSWNLHIAAFKKAHPDKKFADVLKEARDTYEKKKIVEKV